MMAFAQSSQRPTIEPTLSFRLRTPLLLTPRAISVSLRDPTRWLGPLSTLATLVVMLALRPIATISSPGIPLLVTVAASAVLGGIGPGLVSAAITIAFVAADASLPGRPFAYDGTGVSRFLINAVAAVVMALMVGAIRRRLDMEREQVAAQRVAAHERALSETAADAMITIDASGTIRSANPATSSMFGYPRAALIGRRIEQLLAPSLRESIPKALAQYVESGQRTVAWTSAEFIGARADGVEFPIEVSFGEYVDRERYFTWIVRDVSGRKSLEDQLLQAQKMEAVGQLAGGVAHDFNNMLTAIGGFTELMAESPDDAATRSHALEAIRTATERATGLTRQLLAFSRRQRLEASIISLNDTLERIEPLLRRLLGEHVELVVQKADDLRHVLADASQLETAVMNLAINGRDAMPEGGTLTIETSNVELDELYARQHVQVTPGPYAMLSVHDTGSGMDPTTLSHIFEPFYTTKDLGRGTGLGLSSAYGVVRQSGGNIWVYSELGQGTTFKVYLPEAIGAVADPRPSLPKGETLGTGTIVVAEDEPVVRDLIVSTLGRYGYDVLAAGDGREAMELIERVGQRIDLLVSDVVMPNVGGLELIDLARAWRPDLPVILISGYSERLLPADSLARGVTFLEKPFTGQRLAEAIRVALDSGGSAVRDLS
jgi:PAS domain S-box-containing protein